MGFSLNKDRIPTNDGRELQVRSLKQDDVERLCTFNNRLSERSRRRFTPHAYDRSTIEAYVRRNERGEDAVFVAVDNDGKIVAYFFLWEMDQDVPVLGIGIADEYQGVGAGFQIMELLIDCARAADKAGIDLTTMQENQRAFRLYSSVGFEYIGDVSNVAGDGRRLTERRMLLRLKPGTEPPDRDFRAPV